MFDDLDASLTALLTDPGAPAEVRGAEISFKTPDKDFSPNPTTINLFLHGIQENRDLHTSLPVTEVAGDRYTITSPPKRIDCTYLVTAWSSKTGDQKIAEEHRLLGLALLWLSAFPSIPAVLLQGSLRDPPQPYPLPTIVAQSKTDENLSLLWSALGIAPRSTFVLTVTICAQAPTLAEEATAVKSVAVDVVSMADPLFTGRVLDPKGAPVVGATVTIVENHKRATTDRLGRFAFPDQAFGDYTLLIQQQGKPDVHQPVTYQPTAQTHVVWLPAA